MIVINKSNHGMGDMKGGYAPKHELLIYCTKGKHVLNRVNKRKNNVFDLPVLYSGVHHYHPNEKPLSWFEPFIEESSNVGDVILDPFMGSGSLGIKCIDMSRKYIGYEIDEQYYYVAKDRLIGHINNEKS
jgi:DNA modification methylase